MTIYFDHPTIDDRWTIHRRDGAEIGEIVRLAGARQDRPYRVTIDTDAMFRRRSLDAAMNAAIAFATKHQM